MMKIETARLRLIPLSLEQLRRYITEPESLERELGFMVSRDIVTDRLCRAIGMKIVKMESVPPADRPWFTYWLIVPKEDPFGAGLAGFKGLPDDQGQVEIGYGIDPACQRRGFMTEAVNALVNWAFQDERCKSMVAPDTKKANPASNRVLEKAGFSRVAETDDANDWKLDKPHIR